MAVNAKDELHRLVESLPEAELPAARRYLEFLRVRRDDALLRALIDAPEDDEPLTDEEIAATKEGRAAIARGEVRPWEEARAELLAEERRATTRRRERRSA